MTCLPRDMDLHLYSKPQEPSKLALQCLRGINMLVKPGDRCVWHNIGLFMDCRLLNGHEENSIDLRMQCAA